MKDLLATFFLDKHGDKPCRICGESVGAFEALRIEGEGVTGQVSRYIKVCLGCFERTNEQGISTALVNYFLTTKT